MTQGKASTAGIRRPYLRVIGIEIESGGPGRASLAALTPVEEEEMRKLASKPNVQDIIANSIAPSIYGGFGMRMIYWFGYETILFRYKKSNSLFIIWRFKEKITRWISETW